VAVVLIVKLFSSTPQPTPQSSAAGGRPETTSFFAEEDRDPTLAPLRVLVGSPDPADQALAELLRGRGYEVTLVSAPEDVLLELCPDSELPCPDYDAAADVVILDWNLSDGGGLSALRAVRSRYAMPDLPVVLMSSSSQSANVVRAFDKGANEFLPKPLDPDVTLARIHNLVALRRARLALRQQAMVDALTNVFNRRFVMEQLDRQVSQALRYGRRLTFCLCDIDRFKLVNDTHGHAAGDAALKQFARILCRRLRRSDVVGRFGGDELCIIFPETPADRAMVAVEAVRNLVASTPVRLAGQETCRITSSFGVAELDHDVTDVATLVSRADEALYLAKARGRNRACRLPGASSCPPTITSTEPLTASAG
jgi:diguanylate cyclase (GGDEF)-like protein